MSFTVQRQKDISAYNSMALPSVAEFYCRLEHSEQLEGILQFAQQQQLELHILAGGSNSLLPEQLSGLLLHIACRGIEVLWQNAQQCLLKVAAGEVWDELLQYCLENSLYGLENLAIIPGTVGAAPIQNIGAYGVEVASFIHRVHAYDRQLQAFVSLTAEQCQFAYRDSRFKRQRGRYIITAVEFMLNREFQANLSYQALKDRLAQRQPSPENIRQAVIEQRNSRLPKPEELANAGSFFKNPVVKAEQFKQLQASYPNMPSFASEQGIKIPAAWLIEQCGWKGKALGAVGMYEKQALVMVNHGGAKLADVEKLAQAIIDDVKQQFAIELEPEPVIVR